MMADEVTVVDWLDRSPGEERAVVALADAVARRSGWFCLTRMSPGPRTPEVAYWASVSINPDIRFTARADTPTQAAVDALARLREMEEIVR